MPRGDLKNINGDIASPDTPLDREKFMVDVISELGSTLQSVVGKNQSAHMVSCVGSVIGHKLNQRYVEKNGGKPLDQLAVADAMVDLKDDIGGAFKVDTHYKDGIKLTNTCCPFGAAVDGKPSLCMMTANVFGTIAAQNLGYARVNLKKTIARGDKACEVLVHLQPPSLDALKVDEREFFGPQAETSDDEAAE